MGRDIYAAGPSLPDCILIAESHGLVESLVLALTCLIVGEAEWDQAPKTLMLEFSPESLRAYGLSDPNSPLMKTVRANIEAGRDVGNGLNFPLNDETVNAVTIAAIAHWLGFEVEAMDPLHQPDRPVENMIFSEIREREMSRQLDAASRSGKKIIALTGLVHAFPLYEAADASAKPRVFSSIPESDASDWPFNAERTKSLLSKSTEMELFSTSDSLQEPTLQKDIPVLLGSLANIRAAAQQARARAQLNAPPP